MSFRGLEDMPAQSLHIAEGKRLLFRLMMTNAFNHPNFSRPAAHISAPGTVGRISATFNEQLGEDQRWIHFSVRFQFKVEATGMPLLLAAACRQ